MEMFKPHALELMKKKRSELRPDRRILPLAQGFLKFMDASGIDRAMLINYVAPEVIGFTSGVNQFVADYVKEDPKRLLSCGSLHPRHTTNVLADVEQILRLGLADDQDSSAAPVAVSQRLPERGEGTGDHLPRRRGERHSRDVSHRNVDLSRARATSTATRSTWTMSRSIFRS